MLSFSKSALRLSLIIDLYWRFLRKRKVPGQQVIQYTNRCNADCPQCGMRRSIVQNRYTLETDRVKQLIDQAAERGVRALSFTGGEPLLYLAPLVELIKHASSAGIDFIRTGTNGFLFIGADKPDFEDRVSLLAETLAETNLYSFWISLDTAIPEDHERLRGLPGVVKGIEKALPILHNHGIYPAANLGINRAIGGIDCQPQLKKDGPDQFAEAFRVNFNRFYRFVLDLGFTTVNSCYPMSSQIEPIQVNDKALDTALYGAISNDQLVSFNRQEKGLLFKSLFETIPKFRNRLRIFSPRCSLYGLYRKFLDGQPNLYPCRGGYDFFFSDSGDGNLRACGYRAETIKERTLRGSPPVSAYCDLCEWECFRDPSDLFGPLLDLCNQPLSLTRKMIDDPRFFGLWKDDIGYYRACGYFNGRIPPDLKKMRNYGAP